MPSIEQTRRIYRVDKFHVPETAQPEFVAQAVRIDSLLREFPGFVESRVLKQAGGPGRFNFVTMVVWESVEAMAAAKERAMAHYRTIGFDPQTMFSRLKIEADIGHYEEFFQAGSRRTGMSCCGASRQPDKNRR